jgi:uncharacterized protein (TIGR00369 family)
MTIERADTEIPPGYLYEPSTSAFANHIGRVYSRHVPAGEGRPEEQWLALRIEQHHVNTWNLCHGGVIAALAEFGVSAPSYQQGGSAVVAVELSMQFIAAPKLGDLIEVCGTVSRRTRSLVFSQARGEVAGVLMFLATSVQKVIGG